VTTDILDRETAFLGVERSLTGRRWRERAADPEVTRGHQARLGLSEPIARALAARGVGVEDGEHYLRPTFKALFPDPSSFADMDLAARLILDALESDRRIVVFADYDVDGATSAAQLVRWFRAMGKTLPIYVPDRLTEGYGPSPAAFRRLRSEGVELVITVDCGAAANDALNAAAEIGLDVVVVDHHLMRATPPVAAALVNPNRADCGSGQGMLAAAGVTFVLLAALNREARRRDLFRDRAEPDPRQWLDLAALGAICDVTRLTGFNRALTAHGLRAMSSWNNLGLAALMRVAGAKMGQAGVFEAGFILGPRINAGGRIGRADLGARLLATEDLAEAEDLALQLHLLNAERKTVEAAIAEEARAAIEHDSNFDPAAPALVIASEGWHPGVIGIVASRLRETYRKPVVVIGIDRAADIGKGSGRSQPGVNLGRAVQAAFDEGLLLTGGGHAMAAGLTLRPADIPEFRAFLCARLADEMKVASAEEAIDIDVLAAPASARDLLSAFEALAPFGPGNPEPVYAMPDVRCENAMVVRGGHIRVSLRDAYGGRLKAIAWRAEGGPLGDRLLAGAGTLHLVGKLKRDDWNGADAAQFEIEDGADPRRV
jgi:single-stranded-DNA-specific exonuclease